MKTLTTYFLNYFRQDFNLARHLLFVLFIGVCIGVNYTFNVYPTYFRVSSYNEIGVLKLWGMYLFAFFVTFFLVQFRNKELSKNNSRIYLLLGGIGLILVALDSSYYLMKYVRLFVESINLNRFIYVCLANLVSLFSIVLPLILIYFLTKQFKSELYGLRLNKSNIKSYIWLIIAMAPIVLFAAYLDPNFLSYYPSYDTKAAESTGLNSALTVSIYELCYGFDFFSVELLFRGFMVVALSKFVGKNAILPMVACYAFLHFGKPMWETIGSVFGGFGLGILAYESKSIYGGLIVHLGVAWGMELAAFLLS